MNSGVSKIYNKPHDHNLAAGLKKHTVTSVSLALLVYGTPLGLWDGFGTENFSVLLYTKM